MKVKFVVSDMFRASLTLKGKKTIYAFLVINKKEKNISFEAYQSDNR
jgi:hypothetical protein